jgi:hypothetical protein
VCLRVCVRACVCVCVCMYVCVYVCTQAHMNVCMNVLMCACRYVCMYALCMHAHIYICMHASTYEWIFLYINMLNCTNDKMMSFVSRHASRSSSRAAANTDGLFYFDCCSFLCKLYLTIYNQPFVIFPVPQENCLYTWWLYCIVQYVEASEVWRPKAFAYLAYTYSKYRIAGAVMYFLGMLHLLILRKNKYCFNSKRTSETSATPLTCTALLCWVCGGWLTPPTAQHTQTGSSSATIAADSSNGVTNTRCCRYSYMRSWWWVEVPPETCRSVSRFK